MSGIYKPLILSTAFLACANAWAAPGTVVQAADLKDKPFTDAATITRVQAQASIDILGNDKGWTQVKTSGGQTGWLRLLNVRPSSANNADSNVGKSIATLGQVARTGSTGTTTTTGAKGITKDELERAVPNEKEVKKLDQYAISPADAKRFAGANHLKSRDVSYLETDDGSNN